jgi:hypothetical protein
MLEEILTYIQRVQKSDGTSFDPKKIKKENQIKIREPTRNQLHQ